MQRQTLRRGPVVLHRNPVNGSQRRQALVSNVSPLAAFDEKLPRIVGRAAIHVQDNRALANKILAQSFLHAMQRLQQRRRMVMGGDTDEQIDLANTHQLAQKIVREKTLLSQWLSAPCYAAVCS